MLRVSQAPHAWKRPLRLAVGALGLLWPAGGWAMMPAQVGGGELRVTVADARGVLPGVAVTVASEGTHVHRVFVTDGSGSIDCADLLYGRYVVTVAADGFSPVTVTEEIRSALPVERAVRLLAAPVATAVEVRAREAGTLVDPAQPGSAMHIGSQEIEQRPASLPGRSVQDLVNSEPGWLYEGNAVLHPRGAEYQTQFVVDGVPLTENRSPTFGPEIDAEDLQSVNIYTAGFPAEYGRKLGGVVELDTHRDPAPGLHGRVALAGGSYSSASSYGELQQQVGRNTFDASAAGSMTEHYGNPVVPQNYTNTGTLGDFSGRYERDVSPGNRVELGVRHEFSRFLIPNELLQEAAGQRQYGDNGETMGTVHVQAVPSANTLFAVSGSVRDHTDGLSSNAQSTPILVYQQNHFREGYAKAAVSVHCGLQEFKAGVESDSTFLEEGFRYQITDASEFDDDTSPIFQFSARRPDLEESAFVEDLVHLGPWTANLGLRYDHYQLLVNQGAWSPRVSVGYALPSGRVTLHASFDRVFQTPSFENILISSGPPTAALSDQFLRLPVEPSRGNYYEGGLAAALFGSARLDVNVYRRNVRNFADDDQLLNTGVSYPIAFDHAAIYGAEGKLDVVRAGPVSGFVSYSYMVGNVWYPVRGGLFLGDDAGTAATETAGHFPASQDQRHTVRSELRYAISRRFSVGGGVAAGSGLPFEYTGDQDDALNEYGQTVANRLDFVRGRVRPAVLVSATAAAELYKTERINVYAQADGENLTDTLDVIDFGGLFSGNAIGPARSVGVGVRVKF